MTYGIFALSLAFIWGQAGILCFGQAIFFGLGAYLMALTTLEKFSWFGGSQAIGLILAVLGPGLAAHVVGQLLFRGRGLSGAYFAIVTLATAVIVEIIAQHWSYIGGFNGLLGVPPLVVIWREGLDAFITPMENYYTIFFSALLIYLALLGMVRSPLGIVLATLKDEEYRTRAFGYNIANLKIIAFTCSGAVAGIAGGLFTTQFGFVSPPLTGFALSTEVLIWVAVGGRGVLLAAFLGAIVVRYIENVLSDTLGSYWLMALGTLFIAAVVVAPRGLFGKLLQLPLPRRFRQFVPKKL
ncbi:MAG: branched-chain amino acid ABC transporter permease [SAR324 cluster bacterium]|nr:branched-chain amino acid ABC transporter permease [SAR324 cluster bacterium]